MPFKLNNDNTRVLKPLIVTPIRRKLVRRTKNEEVKQDNRPLIIRELGHLRAELLYKQDKIDNAQEFTGQAFANMSNLMMPSHLLGMATSDKPWIETIGNPQVKATGNELANFLLDMTSPSDYIKAVAFIPFIKSFKSANELKTLVKGTDYKFITSKPKGLQGKTVFDWYNEKGSLPGEYLSKFKAILKIAEQGLKGKRGVNSELDAIANAAKARTAEGKADLIRLKYALQMADLRNSSVRGKLYIDWTDNSGLNHLSGMPDWLKVLAVGFDTLTPFLERYYQNVISKIAPLQEKLLREGTLKVTKDGKHWLGKVNGEYVEVDPNRYVISHLQSIKLTDNYVQILPKQKAVIPIHGTRDRGVSYLTQPSKSYPRTTFTVLDDHSTHAGNMIKTYKGSGVSVPMLEKPHLEDLPNKGRMGNSDASGVANGAPPGRIAKPKGVSDGKSAGMSVDEYNFGENVEDIKSYWNTLDFEPGAGPLAMINLKLNQLLT